MRFPEDKIKEAILHPDLDVRDKATRYFYGTTNLDHTLMPLAIRAIETYGRIQAFSYTHYLNLLPQTDQTIAWVIAELQRDFEGLPEDRYFYFLNLSRLLCQADIRLVAQRAVEIHQAPLFDAKERLAFGERIAMFGWNAAQCWQELQRYCQENKDANNFEEFDLDHALRIVDALAHQPHEHQEQIVAVLAEQVQDFRHDARKWLQPLLANLAGEMRLLAAIPLLVGNLGHPYGFLADESMLALAKIGSEEVVSLVCAQYPRASRDFRICASDLLWKIHLDVTVQRVLEILPGENDLTIRLFLCEALLDHFGWEAIEPARQLIKQQELRPDVRHLRSNLIAYCKITGTRFPEYDLWETEAKKDDQEQLAFWQKTKKLAFEAGGDLAHLVRKLKAQIAQKQSESERLEAEAKRLEAAIAEKEKLARKTAARPWPHGRVDIPSSKGPPRLGRNDPCSCGSGRKFKHCCLK